MLIGDVGYVVYLNGHYRALLLGDAPVKDFEWIGCADDLGLQFGVFIYLAEFVGCFCDDSILFYLCSFVTCYSQQADDPYKGHDNQGTVDKAPTG